MIRHLSMLAVLLLAFFQVRAQTPGFRSFSFLDLALDARQESVGGTQAAGPAGLSPLNPALLQATAPWSAQASFRSLAPGIKQLGAVLATPARWGGYLSGGVQYLDYGQMQGYDDSGQPTVMLRPRDFALWVSHSHKIGVFSIGASLKYAHTGITALGASALLLDLGAAFVHPERELTVAIALRNLGGVVSNPSGVALSLPADGQIGISFKPEHMPFRLLATYHRLFAFRQLHAGTDLEAVPEGDAPILQEVGFGRQLASHLVIGTEVQLGKVLRLGAGFNLLRRLSMQLPQGRALAGFTLGGGLQLRKLQVDYTHSILQRGGSGSSLSVSLPLGKDGAPARKTIIDKPLNLSAPNL